MLRTRTFTQVRPRRYHHDRRCSSEDVASLARDVDQLKADLAALVDIDRLGETLKDTSASLLDAAKRQGKEAVDRVRVEAEALADTVTTAGRNQLADAERRIRDQPLLAVSVAFGVGMLVTMLSGRR